MLLLQELWRKEEELRANKSGRDKELARAEKALQASVSRDVAAGLESVRKASRPTSNACVC